MEKSFFKRIAVVFMGLVLTFVMVPAPKLQAATNVGNYTLTLTKKGTKPTVNISKKTSINLIATNDGAVIPSRRLNFKSSNKKIATVTKSGVVTGIKAGKTKINVTYKKKVVKKTVTTKSVLTVNVKEFIDVKSITLSNTSLTLTAGGTASLSAVVAPKYSSLVTWRSFIPEIATVDANGKVTARSPGIGVIAACAGTKTKVCRVTITGGGSGGGSTPTPAPTPTPTPTTIPVSSITLTKKAITGLVMGENAETQLGATVAPANVTNKTLTWASSDPTVASVDQTGKVTLNKIGTCAITASATDGSGKVASCGVTVTGEVILPKTQFVSNNGKYKTYYELVTDGADTTLFV